MAIGSTRHTVTLEAPTGPLVPAIWHCAIQTTGMQIAEGIAQYRVTGRYHPGINLETRILRPGRVPLQVQSVTDLDQRGVTLELICAETVGRHGGQTAY